jgi:hypothetical protein
LLNSSPDVRFVGVLDAEFATTSRHAGLVHIEQISRVWAVAARGTAQIAVRVHREVVQYVLL